jgi:O-antigen ligase
MTAGTARALRGAFAHQSRLSRASFAGDVLAFGVSVFVALEIGLAVTFKPTAALLPLALLGGVLLLVDARARILFVVFGGLLTLQSTTGFGSLKLLYLAGVFVSFAGALFRFSQSKDVAARAFVAPLLRVFVAMSSLIAISFFVAQAHGVLRVDWLRDVAPYVLFAVAPIFALDADRAFRRHTLVGLLVVAGLVATASFSAAWFDRRHIATLPFSQFALPSFFFPGALFAYATASALHAREQRLRWLFVGALVFALLVVTGTRSTLILAIAPVVVAFGARRYLSGRLLRLVLLAPAAVLVIAVAVFAVVQVTHASTSIISNRITILKETGTSSDASYKDRQAQGHAARDVFYAHPFFGSGPGTFFSWRVTNGGRRSDFIVDSPLDFPAKFGLVGLAVILFLVLEYGSFMRAAFRFDHPRPETLALAAFAALAVLDSFLTNPLEDKGCTLGLVLLLALLFRTSGVQTRSRGESEARVNAGP